jgi:O-antigen/teichoic acid export membrane protein
MDQGVVSIANFLTGIIVARTCTKHDFGLYAVVMTLALAASNFQQALIAGPYTVYMRKHAGENARPYAGSVLIHQFLLSITLALGLLLAAAILQLIPDRADLGHVILALAAAIVFILLREFARQFSFAELASHHALAIDLVVVTVQVTSLAALAWTGAMTASRAYLVWGIAAACGGLGWLGVRHALFSPQRKRIRRDFSENWTYARWVVAQCIVFILGVQVYPWFLLHHHGEAANGALAACMGVVFLANPFVLGLGNFIAPRAVHALHDHGLPGLRRVVRRFCLFFLASMGGFALLLCLAGDFILQIIYTQKYAGHGIAIAILAISQWIWAITIPINYGLNALERPDAAFKSLAISTVFSLTAGFLLVREFAETGVALGLLCSNTIAFLYNSLTYRRVLRMKAAD